MSVLRSTSRSSIDLNRRELGVLMLAAGAAAAWPPSVLAAEPAVRRWRGYVDVRFGQLHLHFAEPAGGVPDNAPPPVMCFHPTAVSGASFGRFLDEMGKDRRMIAVDTPGYGKSDRPPSPQPMEELAGAVSDAIAALGYGPGNPVDLWGYHTGSLMALEAARQNPDAVRRVILSAIPYFEGEARAEARERNVRPRETTKEELMEMWDAMVEGRPEGVSAEEGLAKLTDVLQAHPHQWWALEGVFSYPIETMAPQVRQPVRILNVHGSLKDQTAAAAPLFPDGSLVDIPELSHAVFDVGVERLAAETRAFFG